VSDEYLFGDAFLVCPVFNEAGIRNIYLPAGKWVDFWSGEIVHGPVYLKEIKSPLSRMPLFVRHNSIIEFAEPVQYTDQLKDAQLFSVRFDDSYQGFDHSRLKELINI
jgi:alpha-D-xyloside xylohydrolase